MSVAINNLINYSRDLPAPMDTLKSKKVKVSSKYGSGTEATLTCTVIKAVHALCDCLSGTTPGAVGVIDHRMVAEYKSSKGSDAYHLVVYDSASGNIVASGFDKNTEMIETYRLHQTANDGAAVMFAMMPILVQDAMSSGTQSHIRVSSVDMTQLESRIRQMIEERLAGIDLGVASSQRENESVQEVSQDIMDMLGDLELFHI